jgi:acyl-CoA synthetase (NDP forming)
MVADLTPLMSPRSVAVVGASVREDAGGTAVVRNLQAIGYGGSIYPINPRYPEIRGLTCYPSLEALPEPVDAVFIALPAALGPGVLLEAARLGARAAYINASGYADGDIAGKALQAEVQQIAQDHGMAICGPNNTGIVNLHDRVAMSTGLPMDQAAGPVAIITQSGSASLVLSEDTRGLGLGYVITAGNEAVVTASDYLDYVVSDERIRMVLLFLETIRDPDRFAHAAAEARRSGKRILTVKVGRSDVGKAAVMAHTGSLAGDDETYNAFFRKHGIVRVGDFDELIETAVLFKAYPEPPVKPHVVPITLSGGEAALVADLAAAANVSTPQFTGATLERIKAALPPFSQ